MKKNKFYFLFEAAALLAACSNDSHSFQNVISKF